jgi:hypothetical protein
MADMTLINIPHAHVGQLGHDKSSSVTTRSPLAVCQPAWPFAHQAYRLRAHALFMSREKLPECGFHDGGAGWLDELALDPRLDLVQDFGLYGEVGMALGFFHEGEDRRAKNICQHACCNTDRNVLHRNHQIEQGEHAMIRSRMQ